MTGNRSTVRVLALAAAFGVAVALLKGIDPGLRQSIGNLSAPWVVVGFLAGLGCRSRVRGLVTGLLATLVALAAFYLVVTLFGHLGGHGLFGDLATEFRGNRLYLVMGVVSGSVFGAIGSWVGDHRPEAAWLIVGGLLVGEIVVVAVVQGRQLLPAPLYFKWGVDDWSAYIAELILGLGVLACALWRWRRQALT